MSENQLAPSSSTSTDIASYPTTVFGIMSKVVIDNSEKVVGGVLDNWKFSLEAEKEVMLKKLEPEYLKHIEAVNSEYNRHEEFIISEQRKLLEKMIDASMQQFNSKIDFLHSQQESFDEFYRKELELLASQIANLESERAKASNDKNLYMQLSEELEKLEDSKLAMKKEYTRASNRLTDAIKTMEVELQFSKPVGQIGVF